MAHSIKPGELRPDLDGESGTLAIAESRAYHVGLLPEIEVEGETMENPLRFIDCAGIHFPLEQRLMERLPNGKRAAVSVGVGGLHGAITPDHLELLRERLPRLVVRIELDNRHESIRGVKSDVKMANGDEPTPAYLKPRARIVKIPTAEELETKRKNGFPAMPYIRQRGDIPAVDVLYMTPVADQAHPRRHPTPGEPISETGLVWPEAPKKRGRPRGSKTKKPAEAVPSTDPIGTIPEAS